MTNPLLLDAATRAGHYLENIAQRPVFPTADALLDLHQFEEPLPDQPSDPAAMLARLDEFGSPATVTSAGPRYYRNAQHIPKLDFVQSDMEGQAKPNLPT